jgi:hypothetical protein
MSMQKKEKEKERNECVDMAICKKWQMLKMMKLKFRLSSDDLNYPSRSNISRRININILVSK